jgi:bifunctional non-homologous end joining protein LigD
LKLIEGSRVRYSRELPGTAARVLETVKRHDLEGVIAKRRDSLYEPGKRSVPG